MIRTAGSNSLSGGVNGGGPSGGLRGISSNNRGQLATESDGIGSGRLNLDGNLGGDGNDGNDVENMAVDNDEDNVSEQESDLINRQGDSNEIRHNVNDPLGGPIGNHRNDNAEDSDPELDLLAETESDSDDNHSNQETQSAQRSVQTGATAGSDTGIASLLLFPEDESGESSQQEDEESDAAETDEHDQEDIPLTDEQLERRK